MGDGNVQAASGIVKHHLLVF